MTFRQVLLQELQIHDILHPKTVRYVQMTGHNLLPSSLAGNIQLSVRVNPAHNMQNLTSISIPGHQVTPAVAAVAAVTVSSTGPPLLVYTATASLLIMFSSDGKRGHGWPKQEQVPRIGG